MKKLVEKVWNFLSIFVDSDGAYDYQISVDGFSIVVKSTSGIISSAVIKYFVELQSSMSDFCDCGFYVTSDSDYVCLRYFIKNA